MGTLEHNSGAVASAAEVRHDSKKITHKWSIAVPWVFALGLGLWAIYSHEMFQRAEWIVFTVGLSVIVSFTTQLIVADKNGFVVRLSLALAGTLMILFIIGVKVLFLG